MQRPNAEEGENKNPSNDFKKAKSVAFRYLTYRDRSRREMSDHLKKKEFARKTIAETLEYLTRLDYINDERFALNWGKSRAKNKRVGKRRLLRELIHKGISDSLAEQTVGKIFSEFDEWELAKTCAEKKIRSLDKCEISAKRRRLAGYLERKGFPPPVILKAVNLFAPFDGSYSTEES